MTSTDPSSTPSVVGERADLLEALAKQRGLFVHAVHGVGDDVARSRPTVSELSLGGLVKHVTAVGHQWSGFVRSGPWEVPDVDWASVDWSDPPEEVRRFTDAFVMKEDETLDALVAAFEEWGADVDELIRTVDLDESHPLPPAPWFEAGAEWSNRRVFVHLLTELAQHAGHADIIRETIDGQKSMG